MENKTAPDQPPCLVDRYHDAILVNPSALRENTEFVLYDSPPSRAMSTQINTQFENSQQYDAETLLIVVVPAARRWC